MCDWEYTFASPMVELQFYASPRKIVIAAHTMPYFDGLLLYLATYSFGETDVIIYGKGLLCGYGPNWYREIDGNGGFISKEIEELSKLSSFCRIIFPSGGSILWKTGFYVLAKKQNADIVLMGIDYYKRKIIVDSILQVDKSFDTIKIECNSRLAKYPPSPFWIFLRIFFNYGCETFNIHFQTLLFIRLTILILFIYLSISPII